jgi:isoleucyl-tRNA synthetase
LLTLRGEVSKAVEPVRREGTVGHSLDCRVTLYADEDLMTRLQHAESTLPELCIVSQMELESLQRAPEGAYRSEEIEGLAVEVEPAAGEKCPRCWHYSQGIGANEDHPEVCPRCADVMRLLQAAERG